MSINRQESPMDAKNQTNILTRSAFALTISVVSLLLFRGTTSLVSAFIIPVVIALFLKRNEVSFTGILKYLLAVMTILFMGIWLTQMIFLIPLHDMMLRFSNNHPLRYLGILLVEGIAITVVNLFFLKAMTSRIKF